VCECVCVCEHEDVYLCLYVLVHAFEGGGGPLGTS